MEGKGLVETLHKGKSVGLGHGLKVNKAIKDAPQFYTPVTGGLAGALNPVKSTYESILCFIPE